MQLRSALGVPYGFHSWCVGVLLQVQPRVLVMLVFCVRAQPAGDVVCGWWVRVM